MASSERRLGWLRWAMGAAIVVVIAWIAIVYAVVRPDHPVSSFRRAASTPAVSVSTAPTAAPTPSATRRPSVRPSPVGTRPGIDAAGIDVQFEPRPDGSFDVTERLTLPARAASVLVTPPDRQTAGAGFAQVDPTVLGLQIDAAGLPIDDLPQQLVKAQRIYLPTKSATLTLRYQLTGVVVRSKPSTAGRALAFIRPVTADADPSLPVRVHSTGTGTLNIECRQLPLPDQACARGNSPTFETSAGLTGRTSTILVQLDVP